MMEHFAIVVVTILSVGCASAADESPFKITTKRDNDKVATKSEQNETIFSVHSPFGIGQAVIERTHENWSDIVILRLHVKGLEHFKVSNGKVTIEAAVSSQDGKVRIWKDGMEDEPIDAKSPYWMEIRLVGDGGKPATAIPMKDGFFEIQLPKALFEGNPKSITVNWIDFYR